MHFQFDNSYAALPERFFARTAPVPVAAPRLIKLNRALAEELTLDADWLASTEGVSVLAGQRLPDKATPIATAYAGHQFGHFVPQLGDGRAILLGRGHRPQRLRRDLQQGRRRTPFSRATATGGSAWTGPGEYIVSEAMAALGVPTTRALAAVLAGERGQRETMLPGGV